jgi:anti-repressor protein
MKFIYSDQAKRIILDLHDKGRSQAKIAKRLNTIEEKLIVNGREREFTQPDISQIMINDLGIRQKTEHTKNVETRLVEKKKNYGTPINQEIPTDDLPNDNDIVFEDNGQIVTNSLYVAKVFEKQHKNVLQTIEKLDTPTDFNRLNFQPVKYLDGKGEERPCYVMTRDGFTVLVMGFTGKKAMQFKLDYLNKFNQMEEALKQPRQEPRIFTLEEALEIALLKTKELNVIQQEKKLLQIESSEQKEEIKRLSSYEQAFNCLFKRENTVSLDEVARILNIGKNTLMAYMRYKGVLLESRDPRKKNLPTQKYMSYFEVLLKEYTDKKTKEIHVYSVTEVNPKGFKYLWDLSQEYKSQMEKTKKQISLQFPASRFTNQTELTEQKDT